MSSDYAEGLDVLEGGRHRRFITYVDLPSEMSESDVDELIGCTDEQLADIYPEGPEGGAYFHNLAQAQNGAAGSATSPIGLRRVTLYLDLFEWADDNEFVAEVIRNANDELRHCYQEQRQDEFQPAIAMPTSDSFLIHDPSCYYCNEHHDDDDDSDPNLPVKEPGELDSNFSRLLSSSALRRIRTMRNLSTLELHRKADLQVQMLQIYEQVDFAVPPVVVEKLASALDVSSDELILKSFVSPPAVTEP